MRRDDFPLLKKHSQLHYFDSAATTHKPHVVLERMDQFYRERYGTVHRAVYALAEESTAKYEGAREAVRAFIKARSREEIIFTKGTTASLNLLAASLSKSLLKSGETILLTETEHHSNIVPWQFAAEACGAHLRVVRVLDDGTLDLSHLKELLSHSPKLLSIAHVSNVLGTVHPIKEIAALCKENGTLLCVDGAQAVSHLPVDVEDLGCDFYVFSSHKLYGPTGIGVLFGREEHLSQMPPHEGGGDMVETVSFEKTTFQPSPLKFEAGTPPIVEAIGLQSAIEYVNKIGFEAIESHEKGLLKLVTKGLQEMGATIFGTSPDKGAIVSFQLKGHHPLDLATLLDLKGIAVRSGHLCSQPTMRRFGVTSMCRVSFGVYNTQEEVEQFLSVMRNLR